MTSQRALAAGRKRSQAATRLLIAVRRAERPQRTPEDVGASRGCSALVTNARDATPLQTVRPGRPSIDKD
jgi:hypothetical protein